MIPLVQQWVNESHDRVIYWDSANRLTVHTAAGSSSVDHQGIQSQEKQNEKNESKALKRCLDINLQPKDHDTADEHSSEGVSVRLSENK